MCRAPGPLFTPLERAGAARTRHPCQARSPCARDVGHTLWLRPSPAAIVRAVAATVAARDRSRGTDVDTKQTSTAPTPQQRNGAPNGESRTETAKLLTDL